MTGALRYEWRRISSIRSTWILLGAAIVLSAAIALLSGAAMGSAADSQSADAQAFDLSLAGLVGFSTTNEIVLVLLGTVAAQAFGQEYRHGTIRLTLTEFPKRTPVFVAKIVVCCALVLAAFAVATLIAFVILQGNSQVVSDGAVPFLVYFLRTCLYLIGFCLIVFAITALTRVLALGVIIPLAFMVVAEPLLILLVGSYVSWISDVLPFMSGRAFVAGGTDMLRNGAVFGAWVVMLTGAAYALFEKRDA